MAAWRAKSHTLTESNPECYYCECQWLALEALLANGEEAFNQCLSREKLRPFLSEGELQELKAAATAEELEAPPSGGAGTYSFGMKGSSLSYWPQRSDDPPPEQELWWPYNGAWKGFTRAEVYTHPPREGAPYIKELVRSCIQKAHKVIAIVMDIFTDPDILLDLYDAAIRRQVPVYLLLRQQHLRSFLSMAEKTCLNVRHTENLRVRTLHDCTFQSRSQKQITGTVKEKFLLVDEKIAITGSYSFTWTDARLNRHLVTRFTGEVTEVFDQEFRTLYAASCPLPALEKPPHLQLASVEPLPSINQPDVAPYVSVLDGVQLSHQIANCHSVAPQPVARSRAAWRFVDHSGGDQQRSPDGPSALSNIYRNVQRKRHSAAKTTGARPCKSLRDLSHLSQLSGSSATGWGLNGIDSAEEAKGSSDAIEMATHIFIDKENGETGTTTATKDRLCAPSKVFVERSHPKTPLVGRTANVNLTDSQSVRKALGCLNRPLATTKCQFPKGKKFLSKKANENTSRIEDNNMVPEKC